MEEELKKVDVDGVVVTIPTGEKAYLLAEIPKAFGKVQEIIPFEKVPLEERIAKILSEAGAKGKEIAEAIIGKKKAELKEVT